MTPLAEPATGAEKHSPSGTLWWPVQGTPGTPSMENDRSVRSHPPGLPGPTMRTSLAAVIRSASGFTASAMAG